MASALPSVSDCCSACSGLDVTITQSTGYKQVFYGNGDPNATNFQPENMNVGNVYYNLNVPGELWWWSVTNRNWF